MEVICQREGEAWLIQLGTSPEENQTVLEKGVKAKEDETELAMWHPGHK